MTRARSILILSILVAVACGGESPGAREAAERAVLQRELQSLGRYLEAGVAGPSEDADLLIAIRESLVGEIVAAGLPVQGVFGDRYRVRLDAVTVDFRTGLALLQLDGRASLADRPDVFADVTLYGVLEVLGIEGEPPALVGRVEALALATREVGVAGASPAVERLVDAVAGRHLADLNALLGTVRLPVSLERSVLLPAVDTGAVRIGALELGIDARLREVLVADRRLWVEIGIQVAEPAAETAR